MRAIRNRYFARSLPGRRAPARRWARRAARTALSTSAGVARATSASGSSVAGSIVVNVRAVRGRDLAPADEQPVARLERDDVARLGRRRVLPRDRLAVAEPPAVRGALAGGCDARVGLGGHRVHYGTRHGSCPVRRPRVAGPAPVRRAAAGACSLLSPTPRPRPTIAARVGAPAPTRPWRLTEVAGRRRTTAGSGWRAGSVTTVPPSTQCTSTTRRTDAWTAAARRFPKPVHHSTLVSDGERCAWSAAASDSDSSSRRRCPPARSRRADSWVDDRPLPEPRAAAPRRVTAPGSCSPAASNPTASPSRLFALETDGARSLGRLSRPREHLAATSDGAGRTFVLGGRVGGLSGNLATVRSRRGRDGPVVGELPTPRGGVGAFWWPTLGACLVGGESPGGTNAQVECMDPDGAVEALPDLGAPAPRSGRGGRRRARPTSLLGGQQPGLFVSRRSRSMALPCDRASGGRIDPAAVG